MAEPLPFGPKSLMTARQERITTGRIQDLVAAEREAVFIHRVFGGWKEFKKSLPRTRWVRTENGWAHEARRG